MEDFNRSVTIIFWYKVCRDPLVKNPPIRGGHVVLAMNLISPRDFDRDFDRRDLLIDLPGQYRSNTTPANGPYLSLFPAIPVYNTHIRLGFNRFPVSGYLQPHIMSLGTTYSQHSADSRKSTATPVPSS